MLESYYTSYGSETRHNTTQYAAFPGRHTLSLDLYDIRDRASNPLVDTEPNVNEPYHVVGVDAWTC